MADRSKRLIITHAQGRLPTHDLDMVLSMLPLALRIVPEYMERKDRMISMRLIIQIVLRNRPESNWPRLNGEGRAFQARYASMQPRLQLNQFNIVYVAFYVALAPRGTNSIKAANRNSVGGFYPATTPNPTSGPTASNASTRPKSRSRPIKFGAKIEFHPCLRILK